MTKIAILGFGVVGGGVADLITNNYNEVTKLGGDEIYVKHILDLRDFPDSPFADRVTKDFGVILGDSEIESGKAFLRDMKNSEQTEIELATFTLK